MAFNTAAAAPATTTATPANENWKAQGFLNFYLPAKNGAKKKLGAIPLKASKTNEKALLDWLNEDPANAQVILSKLIVEYQSATPADSSGFDL